MYLFLLGATAMLALTISMFFLRFWKTTRDRFFLFFAISFLLEGGCRLMQGMTEYSSEQMPLIYLPRLAAFVLILYAIIDKNLIRNKKS